MESRTKASFSKVKVGVILRQGCSSEFLLIFFSFLASFSCQKNLFSKRVKKLHHVFGFGFGTEIRFWSRFFARRSLCRANVILLCLATRCLQIALEWLHRCCSNAHVVSWSLQLPACQTYWNHWPKLRRWVFDVFSFFGAFHFLFRCAPKNCFKLLENINGTQDIRSVHGKDRARSYPTHNVIRKIHNQDRTRCVHNTRSAHSIHRTKLHVAYTVQVYTVNTVYTVYVVRQIYLHSILYVNCMRMVCLAYIVYFSRVIPTNWHFFSSDPHQLTLYLTYIPILYPTYILAFPVTYILAFYATDEWTYSLASCLTGILAVYLTIYWQIFSHLYFKNLLAILPCIVFDIISGIHLATYLTYILSNILTFSIWHYILSLSLSFFLISSHLI